MLLEGYGWVLDIEKGLLDINGAMLDIEGAMLDIEEGVLDIAAEGLEEKRCLTWSLVVAAMCEWFGPKRLRAEAVMPHWKAEPMMTDQK